MAEAELRIGAKIDFLSPAEHRREIDRLINAAPVPPTITHEGRQFTVDAGGEIPEPDRVVYTAPEGACAEIQRLSIDSDDPALTPAAPLAVGWLRFFRAAPSSMSLCYSFPEIGDAPDVLPVVVHEGGGALILRRGESLVVTGGALTPALSIGVSLQLRLWEFPG